MLKILIVDDEYYFRKALKISLPWGSLGFEICGEAKNGEEALEMVHELQPDIVLVDINMPVKDGLEFVKSVRKQGIDLKIIILTGQSEFAYAKQAVQLGIFNYILKPIDEIEIQKSLLEIKDIIENERGVKQQLENLKRQVKENIPVLRNRLLNECLQGNISAGTMSITQRIEYLDIDIISPYYMSMVIEIDMKDGLNWKESDRQIWSFAVSNIAADVAQDKCKFAVCHDQSDRTCLVIGTDIESIDTLEALGEIVRSAIQKYMKFTVTIGIGNVYQGIEDISISYKEALFALKNRLVLGENRVIPYNMVAETGMFGTLFSMEKRSKLLMSMRIGNVEETNNLLAEYFKEVRLKNYHVDLLVVASVEMVSTCLEFLAETGNSFKEILTDTNNFLVAIQQINSIDELEKQIRSVFVMTIQLVHNNKHSKSAKVVEDVKNYIIAHYDNEELKIDDIAKCVYMNYSHLCFVFKKETGTTINDYLTNVRINAAKELFDKGDQLIQIVANKVGYGDANYFGKCFKKYVGLTPSKYIESKQ